MEHVLASFGSLGKLSLAAIIARFAIDIIAMVVLIFGLYYRRYRDKELVTAAALFNVFVFAVLTILSVIEFSVAAGFGLFAILALFTLRSEPLSKVEMTYFFGSIAIAVICAVSGTSLPMVVCVVVLVLIAASILDHPMILQSVDRVRLTLDKIDEKALSNSDEMRRLLSARLGVDVMSYQIRSIDYANELVRLDAFYRGGALSHPSFIDDSRDPSDVEKKRGTQRKVA